MKDKYIIPILCLLLAACSSEDAVKGETDVQPAHTEVAFSASIGEGSPSRADEDDAYLHEHFIPNTSRIRVVNTVNYSVPDFTDRNQYKEYKYIGKGNEEYKDETWDETETPNFEPSTEGGGFDWNEIRPTAASFVFEAACYPKDYEPFTEVPEDQSQLNNFLKADLLLAHHRQDLNARYDLVKLRFWHAFSMIRVEITLPVTGPYVEGGFPSHAIQYAELVYINRGYEVDYTASIDNNGLRSVTSIGNKSESVTMYPLTYAEPNDDGTEESYVYCGIIPQQPIEDNLALVHFNINTYPGAQTTGGEWEEAKPKGYNFTPTHGNISIRQAHITVLRLGIDLDVPETILLNAKVQPWAERYTEMPLEPDANQTDNTEPVQP